jgi:hypothetical protein
MTRNPILNALAASLYIVVIGLVMFYGPRMAGRGNTPSVMVPIAVISLFTLSAAVMGYVFLYQPLQLFLEGDKRNAVSLFLRTVAVFAGITLLLLAALFSGRFS